MVPVETVSLLRDGIAAARAGDKPRTRELLRQVTELDHNNELAWLWLANSADDPRESLACLRRVLEINPDNEYAAAGLPDALCRAAITAVKSNDRQQAKIWFAEATDLAPRNETAWLWRAGLADSPEEGVELLQFVLAINPNNERAQQGIAHFQSQLKPKWQCGLCEFQSDPPSAGTVHCPCCRGIFSLENPAAFDAPSQVDRVMLEPMAHQLYASLQQQPNPEHAFRLGLLYLNLGYADEGVKALQSAVRVKGIDPAWKAQVANLIKHRQNLEVARKAADDEKKRARKTGEKATIMIVDDSPTIRKLVSVTLGAAGYAIVEAADGYQVADRVAQTGVPSLFLLDINMPGMDGYQLCKMLRQNPDTARTPVIFLTGKDGFFNKLRGQWAGAAEYLTKPFEPQKLQSAVAKALITAAV